jgi:hypothetical protein
MRAQSDLQCVLARQRDAGAPALGGAAAALAIAASTIARWAIGAHGVSAVGFITVTIGQ